MNKPLTCIALCLTCFVSLVGAQLRGASVSPSGLLGGTLRHPSGVWAPLAHQPPNSNADFFTASEIFLMTDGTVLCMAADTSAVINADNSISYFADPTVWRLTPDNTGSYANGTWSQVASMNHSRLYFGSSVLADGRLLVCGGEYADGSSAPGAAGSIDTNTCEIYDPVANTWTSINGPSGWSQIGDGVSMVLPNEKFLLGSLDDNRTAIFDPATNSWSPGANILTERSNEAGWALLPNNRVLSVVVYGHPDSQYYDIAGNAWVDIGNTPTDLEDLITGEMGPSMLMPNGTVFQMGASPFDCIYTPSTNSWVNGPTVPTVTVNGAQYPLSAEDAPGAVEPGGNLLLALGPYHDPANPYGSATFMVETDGTTMTLIPTPTIAEEGPPFAGRFLVLPTGQILYTASGDSDSANNTVYIYSPSGSPQAAWQPTISTVSGTLQQGSANNVLTGTQLNGISQGSSYGDDSTNFTNYPIVRIQNAATSHVFYCRTHSHSTMGVATGSTVVSTQFDVPAGIETGPSNLYVIANGIPSAPQAVNVVAPHVYLPLTYSLFRGALFSGS